MYICSFASLAGLQGPSKARNVNFDLLCSLSSISCTSRALHGFVGGVRNMNLNLSC
jgi:hypothetical protein